MLINFGYFSSIISIFKRSNLVNHYLDWISIYRQLSYPLRSLQYYAVKNPKPMRNFSCRWGPTLSKIDDIYICSPNIILDLFRLLVILFLSLSFLQCSVDSKISNDVVRNYVVTMSFIFFKIIQNCINHHFGICSLNILKSLHI